MDCDGVRFVIGAASKKRELYPYQITEQIVPLNVVIDEIRYEFFATIRHRPHNEIHTSIGLRAVPGIPGHIVDLVNQRLKTTLDGKTTLEEQLKEQMMEMTSS